MSWWSRWTGERPVTMPALLGVTAALLLLAFLFVLILTQQYATHALVQSAAKQLRDDYQTQQQKVIRREVESLVGRIRYQLAHQKARAEAVARLRVAHAETLVMAMLDGALGLDAAARRQALLRALSTLRWDGGSGYVVAFDLQGTVLMYPERPELAGRNVSDLLDAQGAAFFQPLWDSAKRNGEATQSYTFDWPWERQPVRPRLCYIKQLAQYEVVLASGVYLDDVERDQQQALLAEIQQLKYGVNGYFYVDDWQGNVLAHGGQPDLVGRNIWTFEDSRGVKAVQKLIAAAQTPNGAFVSYAWRKPDTGVESEKVSFAMGIPEWQWMIGSGAYLDDIESDIQQLGVARETETRRGVLRAFLLVGVLGLVLFLSMTHVSRLLLNDFARFRRFFQEATRADRAIDPTALRFIEFRQQAEDASALLAERRQVKQQLIRFQEISADFISADMADLGEKVQQMLSSIGTLLGAERGYVTFDQCLRPEGVCKSFAHGICQGCEAHCSEGFAMNTAPMAIVDLHGVCRHWGEQLHAKQIIQAPDARQVSASMVGERAELTRLSIGALLVVPVIDAGRVGGRMDFYWQQPQSPWNAETIQFVSTIAHLLAKARDNLRLQNHLVSAKTLAESAAKVKSTFLTTMSHEIRTPINSIMGLNQLLLNTELSDLQRNYLERTQQAGQLLLRLVNDILDLSHLETGRFRIALRPLDTRSLVDATLDIIAPLADAKDLILCEEWDDQIASGVLADGDRVQQILVNLLNNAVKFTPAGTVTLAARLIERGPEQDRVRFEVRDTGIGLDVAARRDLFEPFLQGNAFETRTAAGSGLGLAICKRLVDAMQGEIGVSSALGVGSCFHVILPLTRLEGWERASRPQEAGLAIASAPAKFANQRVLVVDDNDDNRLVAAAFLSEMGIHATLARDAHEALAQFTPGAFDLILMDLQMPDVDGLEAVRRMRQHERLAAEAGDAPPSQTPILSMSAHVLPDTRAACRDAGFDDHLEKPLLRQTVREALQRWLRIPVSAEDTPASASDPTPATVAELQAAYPLLDIPSALARSNQNLALLNALFNEFPERANAALRQLATAQTTQDADCLGRTAHRLKNTAALIGATHVERLAEAAERTARVEGVVPGTVDQLREQLEKIRSSLEAQPWPLTDPSQSGPTDYAAAQAAARQLRHDLTSGKLGVVLSQASVLMTHLAGSPEASLAQSVQTSVYRLDIDAALQQLETLQQHWETA